MKNGKGGKKKLPVTISEVEFLQGLKQVQSKKIRAAFVLGFYQCMRVSEVISLKTANIDRERGFIHILDAKGGKDRDVPIMKPVLGALRYLPLDVSRQAVHKWVKRYFPKYHFHSFRHSGATHYLNKKKIDVRQVQALLGHSRLDTTMIYTHVTPDDLKDVFDEIWD